jgi:hypothetical protein
MGEIVQEPSDWDNDDNDDDDDDDDDNDDTAIFDVEYKATLHLSMHHLTLSTCNIDKIYNKVAEDSTVLAYFNTD